MNKDTSNEAKISKITQPIAKGCGCFSVFFLVFFVWGIWSTIRTYSHILEVDATVVDFVNAENVFMDARFTENQTPVITYQHEGNTYLDTINYKMATNEDLAVGSVTKVFINPEQPQFSIENSTSTIYFYFVFLVLAIISFGVYVLLKKGIPKLSEGKIMSSGAGLQQTIHVAKEAKKDIATPAKEQTLTGTSNSHKEEIKDAPPWLAIAIAVALVLVGLGMGYYKFSRTQTVSLLKEKGVQTKGIVTYVERGQVRNTERKDRYTISYIWNELPYEYKTQLSFAHYTINEELVLLVNPDNPSQAMLLSHEDFERGSYLFALFLMVMGILIIYYQKNAIKNKKKISLN